MTDPPPCPARSLVFGPFQFNGADGQLHKHGIKLRLRGQPLQILTLLLRRPGELVSRDEFQRQLWSESTFVDFEQGLNAAMNRLRQALSDAADEPRYIETVPGRGYRFIAPVVEEAVRPAVAPPIQSEPPIRTAWKRLVPAAALLAVVGASFVAFHARPSSRPEQIRSLAVLPFVNVSGDRALEYVAEGFSESLTQGLSAEPGLRVIASSSSFRYKRQEADLAKLGERLGVQAYVTGRVALQGDQLQVWAELVDANTQAHLWGERYSRKGIDLLPVQEQIAHEIGETLRLRLAKDGTTRAWKRPTENSEAYRLYLTALFQARRQTVEGSRQALDYLERAVALDPGFAAAFVSMTDVLTNLGGDGAMDNKEATHRAKAAARKALALDDRLGEAHGAVAMIELQEWHWAEAEREFRKALLLNPNLAGVHSDYSIYLCLMGRFSEALEQNRIAQQISPLSISVKDLEARILNGARRYVEARKLLQGLLEMEPKSAFVHLGLAQAYLGMNMHADAISEYERTLQLLGESASAWIDLGYAYAVCGKTEEARSILRKVQSGKIRISPFRLAVLHMGLGNRATALELLERGYAERDPDMVNLKITPRFDALRGEPRFQAVLQGIGLQS